MTEKQKLSLIERYNSLRNKMNSRELLDSVMEVPPAISFYIIKTKVASMDSDLERIKDYMTWYKYFKDLGIKDEFIAIKKQEYYDAICKKYEQNEPVLFNDPLIAIHNQVKKYVLSK